VVKAVSEITGKNFVLDPRVKGTINIVSAKPMSRALVYEVFLSALRLQGFTAVEERGRVAIVPEIDAKLHQSPILTAQEKSRAAGDIIQTQVFKLQYESAKRLVPVLRPLISPNTTITAYQNTARWCYRLREQPRRIGKISESIDRPDRSDSIIIPIRMPLRRCAQTINHMPPSRRRRLGTNQRLQSRMPARTHPRRRSGACACASWWRCSIRPPAPRATFTSST
jgi:general secretion pathway protein D